MGRRGPGQWFLIRQTVEDAGGNPGNATLKPLHDRANRVAMADRTGALAACVRQSEQPTDLLEKCAEDMDSRSEERGG